MPIVENHTSLFPKFVQHLEKVNAEKFKKKIILKKKNQNKPVSLI